MFTYRKLKLKSKSKSVKILSIINYINRRKTSIDIHVSYDLLIKHIAQLCELIISGVEMYENMIIYCLISTAMGIGRDCQSQRFFFVPGSWVLKIKIPGLSQKISIRPLELKIFGQSLVFGCPRNFCPWTVPAIFVLVQSV